MTKFCPNCGAELNEGQDICLKCGMGVSGTSANNATAPAATDKVDKNATIGFVLGLVSIIAWFIPLFGYPVTICGIIFSAKGLKSKVKKGFAITGLILSILFLIVTLVNSILGVIMAAAFTYY